MNLTFVDIHNSALNDESKRDTVAELGERECNLACRKEYYFGFKFCVPNAFEYYIRVQFVPRIEE